MDDGAENVLSPETPTTPRSARSGEETSAPVGNSSTKLDAADSSIASGIPLGSALELCWLRMENVSPSLMALCDQQAPMELVLRWTACATNPQATPRSAPPQSKKMAIPASSAAKRGRQWELPTSESIMHVALTPQLLSSGTNCPRLLGLLLHVTLSPRRSSTNAWSVSFTLALEADILHQCESGNALRVEAGLCDLHGVAVGSAMVVLRCGPPLELAAEPRVIKDHARQPVHVKLQLNQLIRAVASKITGNGSGSTTSPSTPTSMEVILEVSITGQETSRTFRSQPWTLGVNSSVVDLSIESTVVLLHVEDAPTQAVRFVLYRYSPKERAQRLAESVVSIALLTDGNDPLVTIPMVAAVLPRQDSKNDEKAVWGELTIKSEVLSRGPADGTSELLPSAATSVLGASTFSAELGDTQGTLEIEVVEALVMDLPTEDKDATYSLGVRLRLASSQWTATTSALATGALRFRFKCDRLSTAIQWTTKERLIPSLSCELTLETTAAADASKILTMIPSIPPRRGGKSLSTLKNRVTQVAASSTKARGAERIQIPVFFTYPNELISMELSVVLQDDANPKVSPRQIRLCVRMRLLTGMPSSKSTAHILPPPLIHTTTSGHLSVSNIQASGAFLRAHRSQDTYVVQVTTATPSHRQQRDESNCRATCAVADEKVVTWTRSVSCAVAVDAGTAPVVFLRIFKMLEQPNAGDATGELLGVLSVPLPQVVVHQKHLVSFALPFAAVTSSVTVHTSSRKGGTLRFEMQFVEDASPTPSRRSAPTVQLLLQRIHWTTTPASVALTIATSRRFAVQCAISIVGGEALDQVLWSYDTTDVHAAVGDQSGVFVVDCAVGLSDSVVSKLQQALTATSKGMMILKLTTRGGCDTSSGVLGQAVIPMRGGWAAFAELEQCNWHKVYALGPQARESGNPEAIGEIQVSLVTKATLDESSEGIVDDRHSFMGAVDGWLLLEAMEAMWSDPDVLTNSTVMNKTAEAHVELTSSGGAASRRSQKTKPQWSSDGSTWQWDGTTVFAMPHVEQHGRDESNDDDHAIYSLSLVVAARERRVEMAFSRLDIEEYVRRAQFSGTFDDWLVARDHEAQIRLRICYLPAVSGSLRLEFDTVRSVTGCTAPYDTALSIQRLTWRCSSPAASATSAAIDVPLSGSPYTQSFVRLLEGSQLVVGVDTSSFVVSRAAPRLKVQLVGFVAGIQEICLGEACIPIADCLHRAKAATAPTAQWITLHSRQDPTQRVAIVSVRIQFTSRSSVASTPKPTTSYRGVFPSPNDWWAASAAVLGLWKKLFYTLDGDHDGRIDLCEFQALFKSHTNVFTQTRDGKILLRVLFPHGKSPQKPQERAVQDSLLDGVAVERLFTAMDRNGDKGIAWLEFVEFMQEKLLALKPPEHKPRDPGVSMTTQDARVAEMRAPEETKTTPQVDEKAHGRVRELRRKRKEDPHSVHEASFITGSSSPSFSRLSVRQMSAASASARSAAVDEDADSLRDANTQLTATLDSLQTLLALERQKSGRLQEELRSLRHASHELQMQRERALLEEKTKKQFMEQAIQSHEQALRARDATRARHHTASIVLQSKVRMRLEHKKFQALRLQRWNAAVCIQCGYRRFVARKRFQALYQSELWRRKRIHAAARLQRFVRRHVRRKERALLVQAWQLSAVLVQKYVRRWLAQRLKRRHVSAAVAMQSWTRGRIAVRHGERLRGARECVSHWLRGYIHRRRWRRVRSCVARMQRWWRRANELRWEYVTQLEAVMCIQAVWRGHHNRLRLQSLVPQRQQPMASGSDGTLPDLMAAAMGGLEETIGPSLEVRLKSREDVEDRASAEATPETVEQDREEDGGHHGGEMDAFGEDAAGGDENLPIQAEAGDVMSGECVDTTITIGRETAEEPNVAHADTLVGKDLAVLSESLAVAGDPRPVRSVSDKAIAPSTRTTTIQETGSATATPISSGDADLINRQVETVLRLLIERVEARTEAQATGGWEQLHEHETTAAEPPVSPDDPRVAHSDGEHSLGSAPACGLPEKGDAFTVCELNLSHPTVTKAVAAPAYAVENDCDVTEVVQELVDAVERQVAVMEPVKTRCDETSFEPNDGTTQSKVQNQNQTGDANRVVDTVRPLLQGGFQTTDGVEASDVHPTDRDSGEADGLVEQAMVEDTIGRTLGTHDAARLLGVDADPVTAVENGSPTTIARGEEKTDDVDSAVVPTATFCTMRSDAVDDEPTSVHPEELVTSHINEPETTVPEAGIEWTTLAAGAPLIAFSSCGDALANAEGLLAATHEEVGDLEATANVDGGESEKGNRQENATGDAVWDLIGARAENEDKDDGQTGREEEDDGLESDRMERDSDATDDQLVLADANLVTELHGDSGTSDQEEQDDQLQQLHPSRSTQRAGSDQQLLLDLDQLRQRVSTATEQS